MTRQPDSRVHSESRQPYWSSDQPYVESSALAMSCGSSFASDSVRATALPEPRESESTLDWSTLSSLVVAFSGAAAEETREEERVTTSRRAASPSGVDSVCGAAAGVDRASPWTATAWIPRALSSATLSCAAAALLL